jgi:hypothetical protein
MAGLTAVIAGAIAMLSRKQPAVVFITISVVALSRWSEDYHLFVLGISVVCHRDDRPDGP